MSTLDAGVLKQAPQCFCYLKPQSELPLVSLLFFVPALRSIPISYHVPGPSAAILLAFAAYGGAVSSFVLMYYLSPFHLLAKYPGPEIGQNAEAIGGMSQLRG
ncbi:hypothetical protein BJY52DRAFT_1227614 [Lactarius psammicola]|nr:hypothetical protein BJY52DRAFT_1228482 [Lactarius psammicola]KAI9449739.1 hypothetical protein BJY52DRAFT_1227614 [Lactarius psammicola]